MKFIESDNFSKRLKALTKKYKKNNVIGFENLKRLLERQFDQNFPKEVIGPKKIHKITDYEDGVLWKVDMNVAGLKQNKWPRVWFYISRNNIVYFLNVDVHQDNYDNKKEESLAKELLKEFI